jgi:hypothetical protein
MKGGSSRTQEIFAPYAPPTKEEQVAMANGQGPADPSVLEMLAQHADQQADFGEWHYGHLTAQRLRLLAHMLEKQQDIGQEERERLHRVIADLAQQVDEVGQDGEDGAELVIRFEYDGPGVVQIGELHVLVSLLAGSDEQEGAAG